MFLRRQNFILTILVFCLIFAAPLAARNWMGPDAYYDQELDVILRGVIPQQQIYDPQKDVWYNYDINLQLNKPLQYFQLNRLPQSKAQKIIDQLKDTQMAGYGPRAQPNLSAQIQQRRDAETYERKDRIRNGLDPLSDHTQIPALHMPLDPYAQKGNRNGRFCTDPETGRGYICQP